MNRVIALWAVPRSVSTAFEQMMRARGDHEVIHEPFLPYYYYGKDRVNDHFSEGVEPDPSHHHSAILARIHAAAERRPVFFKDMAYHLSRFVTPELLANFANAFLVRDPRNSLPSLYRLPPEATEEEAGFGQQLRLMRMVSEAGEPLITVDADALREDPEPVVRRFCEQVGLEFDPGSLEWDQAPPPDEWRPWERWHREAISSTGFEPPASDHEDADVPPDVLARCIDAYDEMRELAGSLGERTG